MFKFLFRAGLVALGALSMAACTTVDDTLGLDFVPDNQQTAVRVQSFTGINCYLTQIDSIPSSNLGVAFIGTTQSATFGVTDASVLLQYMAGGFKDKENGFGYLPVADTLKLFLATSTFTGKRDANTLGQKFLIYNTNENVSADSTYYTDFDAPKFSDMTEPLFEFRFTDTTSNYMILEPYGAKGTKFLQDLITADKSVYESDTAFHRLFKGFYIAPEVSANKDKQIFAIGLEDSHLLLIGHNHNKDKVVNNTPKPDGSDNKDTLSMAFYFDDGQYSSNVSANRIIHDYTGTPIKANLNDTLPTSTPVTTAYVQSLGGVSAYLRFTEEFVSSLIAAKFDELNQSQYKSMVINKAEIVFYMDDPKIPLMNAATKRLGMYYNYHKLATIPDYYYQYETQQGGTLAYGGYLNRSRGIYAMDITAYVQQLMINPKLQRTVTMAPDVAMTYAFGEVAINSPAAPDPLNVQVKLTYTLIK